jgi:hypothetical protein
LLLPRHLHSWTCFLRFGSRCRRLEMTTRQDKEKGVNVQVLLRCRYVSQQLFPSIDVRVTGIHPRRKLAASFPFLFLWSLCFDTRMLAAGPSTMRSGRRMLRRWSLVMISDVRWPLSKISPANKLTVYSPLTRFVFYSCAAHSRVSNDSLLSLCVCLLEAITRCTSSFRIDYSWSS